MAVGEIIRVILRQSISQDVVCLTAITRSRHDHFSIGRQSVFVFDTRYKPGGFRIEGMNDNGEAERRRRDAFQVGNMDVDEDEENSPHDRAEREEGDDEDQRH